MSTVLWWAGVVVLGWLILDLTCLALWCLLVPPRDTGDDW